MMLLLKHLFTAFYSSFRNNIPSLWIIWGKQVISPKQNCTALLDWSEVPEPLYWLFEPRRDKTNKMACAPSEDSDQPGHPPSLIRVFSVCLKKARILSYPLSAQRRLWSDCADAMADLCLRWAHMPFCWFCHDAVHFACAGFKTPLVKFVVFFSILNIRKMTCIPYFFAKSWENLSYAICQQQRRRSARASAQSDQCLCSSLPI